MLEELCLCLLLEWLEDSYGVAFAPEAAAQAPSQAGWAAARSGSQRLLLLLGTLWEQGPSAPPSGAGSPTEAEVWSSYRRSLEEEAGQGLPGAYILWVPPGAPLPAPGAAATDLVSRVRETALALGPGQRSWVSFPILLRLAKSEEAGAYVAVDGGLSPYWARLSERVHGTYFLDSRPLHRLPEGVRAREETLAAIAELAAELEVNRVAEVPCSDAWTLQRLRSGQVRLGRTQGLAMVAAPPEAAGDGALARRLLHRLVGQANGAFQQRQADLQAALVIGAYRYMEQESVTAFLRGFDPARYSHLDALFLAADGQIKPILPLRRQP